MEHYDHDITADEIRALVGDSPTVWELGAHDGTDTQRLLDAMPGIRLFCWEPDPRPAARWVRKIHDDRVRLWTYAVAEKVGPKTLWLSGGDFESPHSPEHDWDHSSSTHQPTGHLQRSPEITFDRTIIVWGMNLDFWCIQNDLRGADFIRADLQGSEGDMICGGQRTLQFTHYVYLEFYDTPQYEGQLPLAALRNMLPGGKEQWELLGVYNNENALFRNRIL